MTSPPRDVIRKCCGKSLFVRDREKDETDLSQRPDGLFANLPVGFGRPEKTRAQDLQKENSRPNPKKSVRISSRNNSETTSVPCLRIGGKARVERRRLTRAGNHPLARRRKNQVGRRL